MTPKRILAAFDGSKDADERLPVVSVETPPEPPGLQTRVLVGHAAEQILRLAPDTGADLVVARPR